MIFISDLKSNYIAFLFGWIDGFNQVNQFLIRHKKDADVGNRFTWKMFINDNGVRKTIASNGNDLALIEEFTSVIFKELDILKFNSELKIWVPKISKNVDLSPISDEKSYSLGRISYSGLVRAVYYHHCNSSDYRWENLFLFFKDLNKGVGGLVEEMAYNA